MTPKEYWRSFNDQYSKRERIGLGIGMVGLTTEVAAFLEHNEPALWTGLGVLVVGKVVQHSQAIVDGWKKQ